VANNGFEGLKFENKIPISFEQKKKKLSGKTADFCLKNIANNYKTDFYIQALHNGLINWLLWMKISADNTNKQALRNVFKIIVNCRLEFNLNT